MIAALVTGKLLKDPQKRVSANGNNFATATVVAAADGDNVLCNVVAFVPEAIAKLMTLQKGDAVSVSGSATVRTFEDKTGQTRPNLAIKAEAVMSLYEVSKRRKAAGTETEASPYALSTKAVEAMKQAGDIARANDLTVADLGSDLPWQQ